MNTHLRQEFKIKASRNNFLLQVNSPGGARADGKKGVEHLHTGHLQNTQLLATSSTTTTTAMCAVSSHQRHRRVHNAPFTPSFHSLSYIPKLTWKSTCDGPFVCNMLTSILKRTDSPNRSLMMVKASTTLSAAWHSIKTKVRIYLETE